MKGIELAARFSYITNILQFCGPKEASKKFRDYFSTGKNEESLRNSLMRFEAMYPYLKAIAEKNRKDAFDFDVVEAYWIGNSLLDSFDDKDMKKIISSLIERGLPKSIGKKLIYQLPPGFKPHHNFNVFYVGVGMVTGSVATNLKNMNNCRISYGRVLKKMNDKLLINTDKIIKINNKFSVKKEKTKTAIFLPVLIKDIKKNDFVAVHWDFAPMKLTRKQVNNLEKYTNLTLSIMNQSPQ